MASKNRVEIELGAKEEISKALSNVKNNMKSFSSSVKKDSDDVKKSFFDIGKVAETAIGFGIADVAIRATQAFKAFVVESVKGALAFEQQLQALEIQTGRTASALLEELGVATNGLVSDIDLLSSANRALALGLRKDDLPGLFEVAAARAKIMGISVSQAVNDIVTGIGRASPLILDNLGIVFDTVKVYEDYAISVDKTVESLTKQERAIALSTAVINSSQSAVLAFANENEALTDKVQRAGASWDNLKLSVGSFFTNLAGDLIILDDTEARVLAGNEAFTNFGDSLRSVGDEAEVLKISIADLDKNLADLQSSLEGIAAKPLGQETDAQRKLNLALLEQLQTEKSIKELEEVIATGGIRAGALDALEEQKNALELIKEDIEDANFDIKEGQLLRKVTLDTEIVGGEKKGVIDKNTLGIAELRADLQDRINLAINDEIPLREDLKKQLETAGNLIVWMREQQDGIVQGVRNEILAREELNNRAGVFSRDGKPLFDISLFG